MKKDSQKNVKTKKKEKILDFKDKRLITAYIISFVLIFMLYIYEPIVMYFNNINDFWFNFSTIIVTLLKIFLLLFISLSIIFTIIYALNKRKSKKMLFFDICVIAFFIGFICTYIQGNFLANNLPPLDGSKINWGIRANLAQNITSVMVWVIVSVITIIATIKLKREEVVKYMRYVALTIFVMLSASLISVVATKYGSSKKDDSIVATNENIDNVSTDKNFFILLLDAVDSVTFEEEMEKDDDFKDLFKDFTYYKDTMSVYPFTRDSIPMILSGIVNENEDDFATYSTKAFNNSKFLKMLKDKDYDTNIYDTDLIWNDEKSLEVSNIVRKNHNIITHIYLKEQTKYILFKYLPFPLKRFSRIETMDFQRSNSGSLFWSNVKHYERLKNTNMTKVNNKYFQFLHLAGAHVPLNLDKDLNIISNGTYAQKVQASLTIAKTYINRLKENNAYDNSVIIVMADHGYAGDNVYGRQNPILLIKGINEHHDMIKSDIPVSYFDLIDIYKDLLDDKKSTELLKNIDKNRERRYLFYEFTKEDHMVEMVQKGKAWDETTLVPTGKEFNR